MYLAEILKFFLDFLFHNKSAGTFTIIIQGLSLGVWDFVSISIGFIDYYSSYLFLPILYEDDIFNEQQKQWKRNTHYNLSIQANNSFSVDYV